jgi:hypothetical protein
MSGLLVLMLITGCNGSGNNNQNNQESFSGFTTNTFTISTDEAPVEVEDRDLRFDIEDDESVFDQLVMDHEFSV